MDDMRPVASELLAFSPDVIMAFSNPAVALLKPTAGIIPIIFVRVGDPIGDGFVPNLAHPGGNITGFAGTDGPIGGKWLEVLKETAPQVTRVMMLMHPETPIQQAFWHSLEAAAPRFGVEVVRAPRHPIQAAPVSSRRHRRSRIRVRERGLRRGDVGGLLWYRPRAATSGDL